MNDQQGSASKPLYLRSQPSGTTPSKSPAALYGATSAFLPKSGTPTVSITPASAGARLAAFAAGTLAQRRAQSRSPERYNGKSNMSNPRGRQLYASKGPISDTATSTASSGVPVSTTRPLIQTRSSSTLAARHATVQSRSPQRSPIRSPPASETSTSPPGQVESKRFGTDALLGATVSMAASSARENLPVTSQPVKSRILNFEKIPSFTSSDASSVHGGTGKDIAVNTKHYQPQLNQPLHERHTSDFAGKQSRANSTPEVLCTPGPITRQFSEESATSAGMSTTNNVRNVGLKPKNENGSGNALMSTALISKLSQAKGPPRAVSKSHEDYRHSMTVNALADAMVASSLASSRAASPSKKPPPPPVPRRRSRSVATLYETQLTVDSEFSKKRTKAPRPMKHTLRKHVVSDNEEVELIKRGRRHWMRKHPNKYSEGDRKRWRDKVTERERKRYEGVFAANRGLLIGSGHFEPSAAALSDTATPGNHVVNVVVRDIWERSRLPREVLKEVYDLVSPEESSFLNREQFVVGLWLIDQRLKGRKLPVKVSISVWASVRHSQGIKIKKHGQ